MCLWGVAVGSGFTLLTGYRNARGVPAQPPADGATLLVFVHLRCPCTDATMEEDGTTECIGGVCLR